ncbi:MAG: hypothetical protein WBG50_04495, partial [Desulfomonilaceae bacterium]
TPASFRLNRSAVGEIRGQASVVRGRKSGGQMVRLTGLEGKGRHNCSMSCRRHPALSCGIKERDNPLLGEEKQTYIGRGKMYQAGDRHVVATKV